MTTLPQLYELLDTNPYEGSADRIALEKLWQMKVARFDDNAALGEPVAMAARSLASMKGMGTKADPAAACRMARRAYDTGHPTGTAMLAYCLWKGIGIEKNALAAEKILAATGDNPTPFVAVIQADILSDLRTMESERIEKLYSLAAKAGIETASLRLAERHLTAAGTDSEKLNAVVFELKSLIDRKNAPACWLGYRCYASKTKPLAQADQKAGVGMLTVAAEQGFGPAQAKMAREYFQEEWLTGILELKADRSVAFKWAEASVADPSLSTDEKSDAKQIMAICLMSGKGTKQDVARGLALAKETEKMQTKNSVNMTVWLLSKGVDFMSPDK